MFLMRIPILNPLADAVSIFSQIADEANVIFSPSSFSIIASRNRQFVAKFELSIFPERHSDEDVSSRISLRQFCTAMWDSRNFLSMVIRVPEDKSSMVLTFRSSGYLSPLRRELILSPCQEMDLGKICNQKFFIIHCEDFRRIVRAVSPFRDDSVCVTPTHSQVKFSIESRGVEIIITRADGDCQIVGYEGQNATPFRITLQPTSFFLHLTNQAEIVWFYKTTNDSHHVMSIPAAQINVEYLIYFPQV